MLVGEKSNATYKHGTRIREIVISFSSIRKDKETVRLEAILWLYAPSAAASQAPLPCHCRLPHLAAPLSPEKSRERFGITLLSRFEDQVTLWVELTGRF